MSSFVNLKIKEVKEITQFLKTETQFDFTDYSFVWYKTKLELFCNKYKLLDGTQLINKMMEHPSTKKDLIQDIFTNDFELFRDPSLWRCIKDDVLKKIGNEMLYRVFIPSCHHGAELLSFLIIRDELNLTQKVQVVYSERLDHINQVEKGFEYEERSHSLNLSNYKRIDGHDLNDKYLNKVGPKLLPAKILFENTMAVTFNETIEPYNKKMNLILYRNRMLEFNRNLQVTTINYLEQALKPGGYIALGIKEHSLDDHMKNQFTIYNEKESIYKKKL